MLRLDRSILGATPDAARPMGPPVKPEGDGGCGDGEWDDGDSGWDDGDGTDPIAPRGVALDERALPPLPRTTVVLRLDRSIQSAALGAERLMGPPVKPEGDGGWGVSDGGWVAGAGPCGSEVSGGGISDMRRAPPCAAFPAATIGAF